MQSDSRYKHHVDVQILPAVAQDASRLSCLFQLYVYDFSDLLGLDLDEDGRFRPPAFEGIEKDSVRRAFLLRVDGRLAGFALVRRGSRYATGPVEELVWDDSRWHGPVQRFVSGSAP